MTTYQKSIFVEKWCQTCKHEVHGPNHESDKVDVDEYGHDGDSNSNTSKNGTNVPYLDDATSSVLPNHDF